MNIKLTNINPDDYILAIRAAKSFANENKPVGIRHGTIYSYRENLCTNPYRALRDISFYVYRTKTMIVVRSTGESE